MTSFYPFLQFFYEYYLPLLLSSFVHLQDQTILLRFSSQPFIIKINMINLQF